jgi:hypothetical protein
MTDHPESDAAAPAQGRIIIDAGSWISGPCLHPAAAAALALLRAQYPAWRFWIGTHSRRWWACPPAGSACRVLLDAGTPAALAALIAEVEAWGR